MGPFSRLFHPSHADISEDVVAKTGLALFFDILRREAFELVELNLLFVVFSLPVVTIPAAYAAAVRILVAKVQDRNVYLYRDFLEAFRATVWRASWLGWGITAAVGAGAYAVYIYGQAMATDPLYALGFAISLTGLIVVLIAAMFLFPMLVLVDLPPMILARNALLLAVTNLPFGCLVIAIWAAVWLVFIACYPLSILMPALFNFAFCGLVATFYAMGPITRHVIRPA